MTVGHGEDDMKFIQITERDWPQQIIDALREARAPVCLIVNSEAQAILARRAAARLDKACVVRMACL